MATRLPDIGSSAWEHPTDRAALGALQKIPGFDTVVRKVFGTLGERNIRMSYQAESLRVGPRQYPDLYRLLEQVCHTLDAEVPELYISQTPLANAGAVGVDHPFIVVNSSLVELLTPTQLSAVLGHEVGHILSEHVLYRTLLFLLLDFSRPLMPIVGQATLPITLALSEWHRKAQLSSDRAGLLAVQDLGASLGGLAVLAGGIRGRESMIDLESFADQARDHRDANGIDGYFKFMATIRRQTPFPVVRAAELQAWVDGGAYDEIVGGTYPRRDDDRVLSDDVVAAGRSYSEAATKVFADTERHVTGALLTFIGGAQRLLEGDATDESDDEQPPTP